jgi:hypothetical protein
MADAVGFKVSVATETCTTYFSSLLCSLSNETIITPLITIIASGPGANVDGSGRVVHGLSNGTVVLATHNVILAYTVNSNGDLGSSPVKLTLQDYGASLP